MNIELSNNTQAILLLTAPLIVGRSERSTELLTPGEYNKLARVLHENEREPADLLGTEADDIISLVQKVVDSNRLGRLLGRGFLLSQAVEHWQARAIWVISRADSNYPKRLKERLKGSAPALLYGSGDETILSNGGLAVVGSREVDENLIKYTEGIGGIAARAGQTVISGGARGIDRAAMFGSLQAGGNAIGVLADSLERTVLASDNRDFLIEKRLVLISPYDPLAGFDVGHAMQRNKVIYAMADAALVVNSDFQKGGTWAGAIEQLEKLRLVPVYVRSDESMGKGLKELLKKGASPWPKPETAEDFRELSKISVCHNNSKPSQVELPLFVSDKLENKYESEPPKEI